MQLKEKTSEKLTGELNLIKAITCALFFAFSPYFQGIAHLKENPDLIFKSLNSMPIFMGLAISFSSIQDTTEIEIKKVCQILPIIIKKLRFMSPFNN